MYFGDIYLLCTLMYKYMYSHIQHLQPNRAFQQSVEFEWSYYLVYSVFSQLPSKVHFLHCPTKDFYGPNLIQIPNVIESPIFHLPFSCWCLWQRSLWRQRKLRFGRGWRSCFTTTVSVIKLLSDISVNQDWCKNYNKSFRSDLNQTRGTLDLLLLEHLTATEQFYEWLLLC